ncbi:MAG: hypothetical protein HY360_26615 [Verrucomicrobia bacterium]|nr:hypothetical protein [Verrucomicrobiota bacterium]
MPLTWFGEGYDFPADPETGAATVRLTSSLYHHINVYPEQGFGSPEGNIFVASPGDPEPVLFRTPEYHFNHIAVSRCGRYFVAESYSTLPGPVPLVVGNFRTGKYRPLLTDSRASGGAAIGHAHAYFTVDSKHVIYNADPTWVGHVWAVRIPPGFLESLN